MTDSTTRGWVYNAEAVSRILGLPCECNDPVPEAADGEIVIYYGGWDLRALRNSPAGKERMFQNQIWYDHREWKADPGYYRLLLPVPDSNQKTLNEQLAHLQAIDQAWKPAPIPIAATAATVHLKETGNNLPKSGWCLCAERLNHYDRAVLFHFGGRVHVSYFEVVGRGRYFYLAAAQKC